MRIICVFIYSTARRESIDFWFTSKLLGFGLDIFYWAWWDLGKLQCRFAIEPWLFDASA